MGASLTKYTRQQEAVLAVLRKKKRVTTREAADMLDISECTIRRLFGQIEKSGEAVRIYGGIKLPPQKYEEYQFEDLQLRQTEQKQAIGEYASHMVNDGDIIFLDAGTTIQQMTIFLVERFRRKELRDVKVFTNSLHNLFLLKPYCDDINLIGGLFRNKRQDFCGYLSEKILEAVSFQKCFIGADGISVDLDGGVMAIDTFTARINQLVVYRADSVYLLADSSKFGRRSFIQFSSIKDMKAIITDTDLAASAIASLSRSGETVQKRGSVFYISRAEAENTKLPPENEQ